jgi:thiol-disulfide isomerase/thioredoxin
MRSLDQNVRRKNPTRQSAAILFGLGLILLGIVVALWFVKPEVDDSSVANEQNRYSVIPVEVSFDAPDLALQNLTGEQQSLRDFLGQVILVNNWATWCPPCKAEMPDLQAFYEKHKDQGFVLIAIESGESAPEVGQFVESYQLTFPVWLDIQGKALQVFKNFSLPNSYVIDRGGIVRLTWTGAIRKEVLEEYVTPLLKEK